MMPPNAPVAAAMASASAEEDKGSPTKTTTTTTKLSMPPPPTVAATASDEVMDTAAQQTTDGHGQEQHQRTSKRKCSALAADSSVEYAPKLHGVAAGSSSCEPATTKMLEEEQQEVVTVSLTQELQPVQAMVERMETDECMDKALDTDSGIENMETEESQEPTTVAAAPAPNINNDKEGDTNIAAGRSSSSDKNSSQKTAVELREQMEVSVSKVLNATWAEHCKGSTVLPQLMAEYSEDSDLCMDDLVSKIIVEIIYLYFDGTLTKSSSSLEMFVDSSPIRTRSDGAASATAMMDQASGSSASTSANSRMG